MVRMPGFTLGSVQYFEIHPGRLLHTRLGTEPPIDIPNSYQHAWNVTRQAYQNQDQDPVELLLQDRATIWKQIQTWGAPIPRRSQLVIVGDFNTPLKSLPPHVGPGITTHKSSQHRDLKTFQGILQGLGLVAANTWRRPGDGSATFVNHRNQPVQIDFALLRQPCCVPALHTKVLRDAPIVADSGMRHFPIQLQIPLPRTPKKPHSCLNLTAERALQVLQDVQVCQAFTEAAACQLAGPSVKAEDIDKILAQSLQPFHHRPSNPARTTGSAANLETYWQHKHALRAANRGLQAHVQCQLDIESHVRASAALCAQKHITASRCMASSSALPSHGQRAKQADAPCKEEAGRGHHCTGPSGRPPRPHSCLQDHASYRT